MSRPMTAPQMGECDGCGESFEVARMDCCDGEFFCADCLKTVESEAAECADSDARSYNYSRGV